MSKLWWIPSDALLESLDPGQQSYLFQLMQPTHYEAGRTVFSSDLPGDSIYYLQRGRLRLLQKTPVKTVRRLAVLGPGQMFGILGVVECGQKQMMVVTETRCEVLVMRKQAFEKLMKYKPEISERLVSLLRRYQMEQRDQRLALALDSCVQRLARFLYHYLENPDFTLNHHIPAFPFSLTEAAEMVGNSPELTEKAIQVLEDRYIIHRYHDSLQLKDRESLKRLAQGVA
jgi:CRP/FNR family cyclic AMP-dependent transcriptional regulator